MTAQDLMNSVLQLAIQGKLVEQRAKEGTARELIAQIRSEKERLIKAGDIKKEKPLPEVTEGDIPFEIPKNWEWVRLGKIGSLTRGNGIKRTETIDKGFSCVRYGELYTTYKIWFKDTISFINEELYSRCQKVQKGDVLMTLTGENKTDIAMAVAYLGEDDIAMGGDMTCWSNHLMEPLYLVYLLNSSYCISCKRKMATGDIIVHISNDKLATILLPIPPLAEQKRIVARIEELLPYIEKYDKVYTKLETFNKKFPEDMQKSILQYAMQGKLVEQRPEEGTGEELYWKIQTEKEKLIKEGKIKREKILPKITEAEMGFNIPKTWKWTHFGNIISLLSGTDFKPDDYNDQGIGTVYITGASNLDENGVLISRWTETPRNMAYQGDVLLICKGSGYGKTVICDIKEAHIARQIMSIRKMENLDMKFIKYYLNANFAYLKSKGQGVIPGIDRNTVLNMVFPLPPYKEQKRIVTELEKIIPYCEGLHMRHP